VYLQVQSIKSDIKQLIKDKDYETLGSRYAKFIKNRSSNAEGRYL